MLQFSRWQIGSVIALVVAAIYLAIPNFVPAGNKVPGLPNTGVTLGLDLQGGSHLLLEVDTAKVVADRVVSLQADVRRLLRQTDGGRIAFDGVSVDGTTLTVDITSGADVDRAVERLRALAAPVGGLTGGGAREMRVTKGEGRRILLEMTPEAQKYYADNAVTDSIEVVRRRIDALGNTEPLIQRQGPNRLVVQVPGESDSEGIRNVINRTGQMSFHMVDEGADPEAPVPPRRLRLPTSEGFGDLIIEETPEVTGDMVTDASASPNSDGAGFQVNFAFDTRGARRFGEVTKNNIGRRFAIVLDNQIISAPEIQSAITGGSGRITGRFSAEEASQLAILIRSGALPAPLTTVAQRTVGADLGADSVRAGTISLAVGFAAVVLAMVFFYGRFGIYANIALLCNAALMAGALSALGSTLTLPGIAGILLTIGMAVDANVLIFERIREELRAGKAPVQAIENGFRHAWSAILDSNLTTLIACLIMFLMGAGPVRGFAITLGIGVITSVFTAFIITRLLAGGYVLRVRPKTLKI